MAKKREIKTLRQQREEHIQRLKDLAEQRFERFRDRLIQVRTPGKLWSILEKQDFFVCGYCGQRMSLFSPLSLTGNETNPQIYYCCIRRCESSGIHRAIFIDAKLLEFLFDRLRSIFSEAVGKVGQRFQLDDFFEELARLESERKRILELLPHAGYNREKLLKDIISVEDKIYEMRRSVAGLDSKNPEKSKLLAPIFSFENVEELKKENLLYKREFVKALVKRMRFFNETLILRVTPLTDDEREIEKKGEGKLLNIHLSYDARRFADSDAIEPEETKEVIEKATEKLDIDFIMSDKERNDFAGYEHSEKIDIELLRTEPGSEEEEKLRKKI